MLCAPSYAQPNQTKPRAAGTADCDDDDDDDRASLHLSTAKRVAAAAAAPAADDDVASRPEMRGPKTKRAFIFSLLPLRNGG